MRFWLTFSIYWLFSPVFAQTPRLSPAERIVAAAAAILDKYEISYAMGGSKVGEKPACDQCNLCLGEKAPDPKARFAQCPVCLDCSLDCSHFVQHVLQEAGLPIPYLNTETMQKLSDRDLRRKYKLGEVNTDVLNASPGDILVYPSHVVILEKNYENGKGDIIHATAGKELRAPGAGIQRSRMVNLKYFRGPLQRILRRV